MSRAGARQPRFQPGFNRLSDTRISWLRTQATGQIAINVSSPEQRKEHYGDKVGSEVGDSVTLTQYVPGRNRPLTWDLTGMTTEELEATRKFFDFLFDLADPIVRERDKVANEALAEGDDSYSRVYRESPTLVVRERQERSDSQGVHDGPENVSGEHGSSSNQ